MSYYILPKINNLINVNPLDSSNNDLKLYVSHSLFNYYSEITQQIKNICLSDLDFSFNIYNELIKIVNPYEYVFSNVPGSKFSVSKLKPKSNIFYDFLEISFILNIGDAFKSNRIKTLHITPNSVDTVSCIQGKLIHKDLQLHRVVVLSLIGFFLLVVLFSFCIHPLATSSPIGC